MVNHTTRKQKNKPNETETTSKPRGGACGAGKTTGGREGGILHQLFYVFTKIFIINFHISYMIKIKIKLIIFYFILIIYFILFYKCLFR